MPAKRSSTSAFPILFATLSTLFSLSGCAPVRELLTEVRIERPKVDPQALSCRERPGELGPDATWRDLVAATGEAIDWGADCEDRLATVAAIVAPRPADQQAPPPAAPTTRQATAWVIPRDPRPP